MCDPIEQQQSLPFLHLKSRARQVHFPWPHESTMLARFSRSLPRLHRWSNRLCLANRPLSVEAGQDSLVVRADDGKSYEFLFQWLRDHCRHPTVYNHTTNQRAINLLEFSESVKPSSLAVKDKKLLITWDDGHSSEFGVSWLLRHHCADRAEAFAPKTAPRPWSAGDFPWESSGVDFARYMDSTDGLRAAVASLLAHGLAVVRGAPPSLAGTRAAVERMAPPAATVYGDYYELTARHNAQASDSSYSNVALGLHTDTTYYSEAYGLQVFHATRKADSGGDTLLMDGFKVAEALREQSPEAFAFLSQCPLEAEYIHDEEGSRQRNFLNVDHTFKTHPVSGQLQQFRFNVYDRAIHRMPVDQQRTFYRHYRELAAIVENRDDLRVNVSLSPGSVLLLDNWRVMHGRTAFEGERTMTGCYVSRTDFMSAARVLDLV